MAYEVLKAGMGSLHPVSGARTTAQLSGWTSSGALFESTIYDIELLAIH